MLKTHHICSCTSIPDCSIREMHILITIMVDWSDYVYKSACSHAVCIGNHTHLSAIQE